jgi:hypothetical protein
VLTILIPVVATERHSEEVAEAMQSNDKPTEDVYEAFHLPERVATGYRAMYVHGMHLRIRDAEIDKVTCESRVAAAVWKRKRSRDSDTMDDVDSAEYVGWGEEILELNYCCHCCIVLCSWIPRALGIRNAKVEKDKYGFLLENFIKTMHVEMKSFVFPTQCQQVFFSNADNLNAERGGNWKVICSTEVRGKRGNLDLYRPDIKMLALGQSG